MTARSHAWAPPYPASIVVMEGGKEVTVQIAPEDIDVRSLDQMPLDVKLLGSSELAMVATDSEFRAAVTLWCRSWHQVPAASLPDDEAKLAYMAGFGRDLRAWKRVRTGALRGFRLASDGRLYHPVVASFALRAFRTLRSMSRNSRRRWEKAQPPVNPGNVPVQPETPADKPPQRRRKAAADAAGDLGEGRGRDSSKPSVGSRTDGGAEEAAWRIEFVAWYAAYPKRVGRGQAERAYLTARRGGADPKAMLEAATRYRGPRDDGDPRFMKNPSTWLNGECWADEPTLALNGHDGAGIGKDPRDVEHRKWRSWLQTWKDKGRWWDQAYQCDPPGSREFFQKCPPEVAAEFGLTPSSLMP